MKFREQIGLGQRNCRLDFWWWSGSGICCRSTIIVFFIFNHGTARDRDLILNPKGMFSRSGNQFNLNCQWRKLYFSFRGTACLMIGQCLRDSESFLFLSFSLSLLYENVNLRPFNEIHIDFWLFLSDLLVWLLISYSQITFSSITSVGRLDYLLEGV